MIRKISIFLVLCFSIFTLVSCNNEQKSTQVPEKSATIQNEEIPISLQDQKTLTNQQETSVHPEPKESEKSNALSEKDVQIQVSFNNNQNQNKIHANLSIIPKNKKINECIITVDNGVLHDNMKQLTVSKDDFASDFSYDYEIDLLQLDNEDYIDKITIEYIEDGGKTITETVNFIYKNDDTVTFVGYYFDIETSEN